LTDGAQVQHRIDVPQQMIRRHVALQIKPVKKPLRFLLPPHHGAISSSLKGKQRESRIQPSRNREFFNEILDLYSLPDSI
jgi:hypothetical protein